MNDKNVIQATQNKSYSINELNSQFYSMNAALHTLSSMIASETKIALSDLVACEHLRLDGPLTAKEVARRVQMGSGATTALLDRLEQRGLVERKPHPHDRRSVMVHYVNQVEANEMQLARFIALLDERLGRLEPAERAVIGTFLKGVTDDIGEALGEN